MLQLNRTDLGCESSTYDAMISDMKIGLMNGGHDEYTEYDG